MAARNNTIDQERAAFLLRFRHDPAGLVYSRAPGGEGRMVSEDEAVAILVEFELMSHRHTRRFSRSVWIAVIGFPLFGMLGIALTPLFGLLAIGSLVGWFVVAVVQRLARARFIAKLWSRLDRNPPVRALSRSEKLARGFAVPWWQTAIFLFVIMPFTFFVWAPTAALPERWRNWQMTAIALLFVIAIVMVAGRGIWWWVNRSAERRGRPTGPP